MFFICFYNEPEEYNIDLFYNGLCPPEIIPVETPLRLLGRSSKTERTRQEYEYCYIEIDSVYCIVNGTQFEWTKPIKFQCEEKIEDIPKFIINAIKIKNNFDLDNIWFNVDEYQIKQNEINLLFEMQSIKIEEKKPEKEKKLDETIETEELEITVSSIVKKVIKE